MDDRLNKVREISDEEERLVETMRRLEAGSLDALMAAGREIIGLVTALLGLFLGLLAFKESPVYLSYPEVDMLSTLIVVGLLAALLFALAVVLPRPYHPQDLAEMRAALNVMYARKRGPLTWAMATFGVSIVLLALLLLDLILFR